MQIEMERKMSCIPNDIVVEILSRLPAKSLLPLRWTCKYWFDLITRDSDFIKMHLHYSTTHDDGILSIISFSSVDGHKYFQSSLDYSDTTRVGDVSREICFPLPSEEDYPQKYHPHEYFIHHVLGSCNGLILFYQRTSEELCIWNPCTKEYKILPHPPTYIEGLWRQSRRRHYGFSYDHTTDDYKVIRITYHYVSYNHLDLHDDIQVYTLGTNSWRRVIVDRPETQRLSCYQQEGVCLDGVIYWTDSQFGDIISFDIEKENFQHVSKIPNSSNHWSDVKIIRVFEGSMCGVIRNPDHGGADMWVLNNNNNNNKSLSSSSSSWTKLSTIPDQDQCLLPIMPYRFTRNGQILMVTHGNYIRLYDPKNNNVKTLCQYPNRYLMYVYTESLVSLNSGTYIGQDRRKEQQEEEALEVKRKKET